LPAGEAVGDPVGEVVGELVTEGEPVAAGEDDTAGLGLAVGLFCVVLASVQAPRNAADAAQTVSRNDLLIVFTSIYVRSLRGLSRAATTCLPLPPGIITQPDTSFVDSLL
jgi:hypothetical protein